MALATATSRNDYIGNGSTSVYSYSFRIVSDSDLLVTKADTSLVETTLVLNTDYTVSGAGTSSGSITLLAGNLPASYKLTIRRVRPVTQGADIRNQGSIFPEDIEDIADQSIMVGQQLTDSASRSLHLPETEAGTALKTTMPTSTDRVNKVLGFDASGNPIAVSNVPTSGVTASAFMQTLLDDANAPAARTTLGLPGTLSNQRVIQSVGGALIESAAITINRALVSDSVGIPVASATTATELGYVSGVSSAIQTQLNGKIASSTTVSAAGLATGGGDLSANRTITVTAATQSDQETGTSTAVAVVPGVQHHHASAAKAWVYFTTVTTTSNLASYNISSLTDNGVGDTTINFTTSFSSANYAAVITVKAASGIAGLSRVSSKTSSAIRILTFDTASGTIDVGHMDAAFFGDF